MLKVKGPSDGGSIRCIPLSDSTESSIGFYRYTDERGNNPGEVWVAGQNAWTLPGFSIGTPFIGSCFNINAMGMVSIPYYVSTPLIYTDIIRPATVGALINIDTNVSVNGNLTFPVANTIQLGNITMSATNIAWNTGTNGPPTLTNRSGGTRLVIYPSVGAASVDSAIGIDAYTMWYSVGNATSWHRWYNNTNQTMNLTSTGLVVAGQIYQSQVSHSAVTITSTLTTAQLLTNILAGGPAAAITLTLPTGALTHTGLTGGNLMTLLINQGFEWSFINTGTFGATIAASTNHSILMGSAVVAPATSARFLTRITAKDIAVTYRIA
jgi:hypothetical protein